MAHIGLTVSWFIEGGFGEGFDMNFEEHDVRAEEITSLTVAREICTKGYNDAIKLIESKTPEELNAPMPEGPIMGGAPKFSAIFGIVEHSAHHRGSLSTYTRLCGKVPPMPYMDAEMMESM